MCGTWVTSSDTIPHSPREAPGPGPGWGGWRWSRGAGLSSQVLSQLPLSLSPDFLRPVEPATPAAPPSWGLEVPSGDRSGSVSCSSCLHHSLPKPSLGPSHPYLDSE